MTAFTIPTSGIAEQFSIALSGTNYVLRFYWCDPAACWIVDVEDSNGVPMAMGIAMVTGADLLEQLGYLGIPGEFIVQSDNNRDEVPDFDTLGSVGHLYYVTTP